MNRKINSLVTICLLTCGFSAMSLAEVSTTPPSSKYPLQQNPKQTSPKKPKPVSRTETCTTRSGRSLCQALYDLSAAYGWNCHGNACEVIWSNQINQIRQFNYTYDQIMRELSRNATFNIDIGRRAQLIASNICGTTATGDPGDIANLAFHENLVLPRLEEIQRRTPHTSITTCEKIVQ